MIKRMPTQPDTVSIRLGALWLRYWQRRTSDGTFSTPYWC